jgi:diguanylate cyclase (GGDEF)-like protein
MNREAMKQDPAGRRITLILYLLAALFPIAIYIASLLLDDTANDARVMQKIGHIGGMVEMMDANSSAVIPSSVIASGDAALEAVAAGFVHRSVNQIDLKLFNAETAYAALQRSWEELKKEQAYGNPPSVLILEDTRKAVKQLGLAVDAVGQAKRQRTQYLLYAVLVLAMLLSFALIWYVQRYLGNQSKRHQMTDHGSGLHNRAYFLDVLESSSALAARHEEPLSLVLFGIDDFELCKLTERDDLVAHFGRLLQPLTRTSDIACRIGENEYVIIAPKTEAKNLQVLVERIRKAVASDIKVNERPITISAGIVDFVKDEANHGFLVRAEKAMVKAKKYRNRTIVE